MLVLSMSVHSNLACTCCNIFLFVLVLWCFICRIGATLDQGVDLEDWLDLSMN